MHVVIHERGGVEAPNRADVRRAAGPGRAVELPRYEYHRPVIVELHSGRAHTVVQLLEGCSIGAQPEDGSEVGGSTLVGPSVYPLRGVGAGVPLDAELCAGVGAIRTAEVVDDHEGLPDGV